MNDSAAQSPHPSALENVLREALLAHPDICHTKLTSFWEQSGESSLELDRFKHIWSKAHVSSRVFGQARGIDIEKLSQSLVHEGGDLFRGTAPRARLAKKRASAAAGPSSGSAAQSSALLGELDGYRRDLRRLDAALHQVGRGVEQAKESEKQTSVALLDTRRSLRVLYYLIDRLMILNLTRVAHSDNFYHNLCAGSQAGLVGWQKGAEQCFSAV